MGKIPFNKPYNSGSELYYIAQSVLNGHSSGDGPFGKKCEDLLKDIMGVSRAPLLTTSCTSALEISAMQIDFDSKSEFILPSYTFVSTANAFCLRGAKPIFADIDPETLNVDLAHVESLVSNNTKVIVPVHYAGTSCDLDELLRISRKNNILVVEDAAQAITSTYKGKALGTFGDFSAFSFHETKNIICGEGGALFVNNENFRSNSEIIREKGTDRAQFFRGQVDKYTWRSLGSSYVLSDISAAFLLAQLENIASIQKKRMSLYNTYLENLSILQDKGILKLPSIPEYNEHNAHIFYLLLDDTETRKKLISYLKDKGIMSVFHYIPLHDSPMGENYGYKKGMLPVTESISSRILRLPLCSAFTLDEIETVSDAVLSFFGIVR